MQKIRTSLPMRKLSVSQLRDNIYHLLCKVCDRKVKGMGGQKGDITYKGGRNGTKMEI